MAVSDLDQKLIPVFQLAWQGALSRSLGECLSWAEFVTEWIFFRARAIGPFTAFSYSRVLLQLPFLFAIPAFNMVFNDLRQARQQVGGNECVQKVPLSSHRLFR
jgi:hypothetical protein